MIDSLNTSRSNSVLSSYILQFFTASVVMFFALFGYSQAATTLVSESFEDGFGVFIQNNGNLDWTRDTGGTPTSLSLIHI